MRPKFPTWLPGLLVFAAGAVAMKAAHVGVFAEQSSSRRDNGSVSADGGSTTSTTYDLSSRTYRPGDCVRWDQSLDGAETRVTKVVSCDEPHLIEMTGRWVMPILKSYPTDDEWNRLYEEGECSKQVAQYLGGEIDPYGRFSIGGIQPTFRSWAAGAREVWCGVQSHSRELKSDPNIAASFTGKVQGQPQGYVEPAGTCLAGNPATYQSTGQVPCTEAHIWEVVGDVDSGQAFTTPPATDSDAWNDKLRPACTTVAKAAFVGRITKGVDITVSSIDAASWRTGQRRVACYAARYDATNHPIVLTAPLLPPR